MRYIIKKSLLHGDILIPPSKSHTLRAILFAAMAHGRSVIYNYLRSPDTEAMVRACRLLGATLDVFSDRIEVAGLQGKIPFAEDVIDAGNSGIVLRFCAALGALSTHPIVITGDHSIRHQRPIRPLIAALEQLGVACSTMRGDGYAPLILQGPLKPGKAQLCGNDSQPISALLIAASFLPGITEITVRNPGEKPWIELTLHWLERLGISYENHNFEYYRIFGNACYEGFMYTVPGDFSSAAFPIAAALITGSSLTIKNIDINDCQGDKELIDVFKRMGGRIEIDRQEHMLFVEQGSILRGISVDINNYIDALPILSVVACFAQGTTHIYNAAIAREKECDRIGCIAAELKKMGAIITETEDGLIIEGSKLQGAHVFSHHDHRMAMALSIAALAADGTTCISSTSCIAKTFPKFGDAFQALGASIIEYSENKNVILCGLQRSGKTTIGKKLADQLGLNFIDTDELIKSEYLKQTGNSFSCKEIALQEGEPFFRKLEQEIINNLEADSSVIATGGGSICHNEKQLKKLGSIIYLKTSLSITWERIREQGVPSYVDPENPEGSFYAIAEQRLPLYEKIADLVIDTHQLDEEAIIARILQDLSGK